MCRSPTRLRTRAALDVLVVRKLGLPRQPELAVGAIASGGARHLNDEILRRMRVSEAALRAVETSEGIELARREKLYRGERPPPEVRSKTVIVVDDGMATGASMCAAVMALRSLQPARIVVAVPVASSDAVHKLKEVADEFVCILTPIEFFAVGQFYRDFDQTTDVDVRRMLDEARKVFV